MGIQSSFIVLFLLLGTTISARAEPEALAQELPRIPPTLPDNALETFEVKPGFTLELAAHEPLIEDPIDAIFDEDGRLFVVEMRGYSERRDSKRGRIRLLHDDDDDGAFDRATDYVTGLRWPTSVACFDGGIFVAETPDILYCKDTDGDGVSDTREVVFTGFGLGKTRLNVQAILNGLQWGPDNRIWGATSMNGGDVGPPGEATIKLNGQDFSFDPRKRDLRAENGTAQNGMSFDSRGRRYVCSNSNHLIAVMWERDWVQDRPHSLPNPLEGIATDGGAAPVFRISPDEPWRIVRTRWRVAGVVGGPVEGGGRVSGYFTGASGVTIYTGDAYPTSFRDNAFTGDVGSNLVHRKIIQPQIPNGLALKAARPKDEQDKEFLASHDNWFRPANFTNGPDGCLYVIDMYREIIEHPWSLPPGIKKHLDLNSGSDRGRIYRLNPADISRRSTPKVSSLSNDQLADLLDHANGWHRVTAQRLLFERGDVRAQHGWGDPSLPRSMSVGSSDLLEKHIGSEDPWLQAAALHSLRDSTDAVQLFDRVRGKPRLKLAKFIGERNDPEAENSIINAIKKTEPVEAFRILRALGEGKAKLDLDSWFQTALNVALDAKATDTNRRAAVALLELNSNETTAKELLPALEHASDAGLQEQLIATLAKHQIDSFAAVILERWSKFSSRVQAAAINALLANPTRILALLEAIQTEKIPQTALSSLQIKSLRDHANADVRATALKQYPVSERPSTAALLDQYRPALTIEGDPAKGRVTYEQRCVSCHRFENEGHAVGPDLVTFATAGRESLLTNILDPNREVAPRYQAYTISTKEGDTIIGTIVRESTIEVTIRQPFGIERTVIRKNVTKMQSLGTSLMPAGLEAGMAVQEMANLLAFISQPSN